MDKLQESSLTQAYQDGRDARRSGQPEDSCPYGMCGAQSVDWRWGWLRGEDKVEAIKASRKRAYHEGYDARSEGGETCPHTPGCIESYAWWQGWDDCDAEISYGEGEKPLA